MGTVADVDTSAACAVFSDSAETQLAAAFNAPDCRAAVIAWHTRVTRPSAYDISVRLKGETTTVSPDREIATPAACGMYWYGPLDGLEPPAGPADVSRMGLRRVLGQGYEITDYRPC